MAQRIFEEEGKNLFTARTVVLGHLQQGGNPSPHDRCLAVTMATNAYQWACDQARGHMQGDGPVLVPVDQRESAIMIGLRRNGNRHVPLADLREDCDISRRLRMSKPWMRFTPLISQLAKYGFRYEDG